MGRQLKSPPTLPIATTAWLAMAAVRRQQMDAAK
jgi:hypothetical protein